MRIGEEVSLEALHAYDRWRDSKDRDHLEAAIRTMRRARYLPWQSVELLPYCLMLTVDILEDHLQVAREAKQPDEDELIEICTVLQALEGVDPNDKPIIYGKRGWYLMQRYIRQRSLPDLNEAVVDFKIAGSLTRFDQPEIFTRMLNIAWACEERFDRTRANGEKYLTMVIDKPTSNVHHELTGPRDLVVPITGLERLLLPDPDLAPAPPLALSAVKRNLANLLCKKAIHMRSRSVDERNAELLRAIELLEQALVEPEIDAETEMTVLVSLLNAQSTSLRARDGNLLPPAPGVGRASDLDHRIARLERLELEDNHPELSARLRMQLAALLLSRESPGDHERAIQILRTMAAAPGDASTEISLQAATQWARYSLSHRRWRDVVEAADYGSLRVNSLVESQSTWLSRYQVTFAAGQLAAMAAYAQTELGHPADAVATLEARRAVMISAHVTPWATEHDRVPQDTLVIYLIRGSDDAVALCSAGDNRWRVSRLAQLLSDDGLSQYLFELDAFRGDTSGESEFPAVVSATLSLLRGELAGVLEDSSTDVDIVVIPVGALTFVPTASAFIDDIATGRSVTVLPTRRLLAITQESEAQSFTGELVFVRDYGLPASGYEEAIVSGFFPRRISVPASSPKAALLASMPHLGVVHFACHAHAEPGSPLSSGIALPNGETLTASDLLSGALPPQRLAVLSACETGIPDPENPDEGISLAAALLATQTQGVISTLWPVEDLSTTLLMARFYWSWRALGMRPPVALTDAQRWQARSSNAEKLEFLGELRKAGQLSRNDFEDMSEDLTGDGRSTSENSYSDPYFWAGFVFSGR